VADTKEITMSSGSRVIVPSGVKQLSIRAKVIRCKCSNPKQHADAGLVCPEGVSEGTRVVAYWHRNPLRRLAFRIKNFRSR